MTHLIPTLVLAILSFLASAFVILRIVLPILPPSPLSRRVSPSEFGLPICGSLSPADKGHLWLAGLDLLSLVVFVWQVPTDATSRFSGEAGIASQPLSSARLWFVMTTRQGCLLVVAALTLLHVRLGRSLSLGKAHWMIWGPVVLLTATSTSLAAVMSAAGVNSLPVGLAAYSGANAILTTTMFATLFFTLYAIKRNLAALTKRWPSVTEVEQGRPSFATEEIDAIKDGASWVTSNPASYRSSLSAWSFSTHKTAVGSVRSNGTPQEDPSGSLPGGSFWFSLPNSDNSAPQLTPIPSSYGTSTIAGVDPDPFRRELPILPNHPRGRAGSQCSWLTSTDGTHTTFPAWSFPSSHDGKSSCPSVKDSRRETARPTSTAIATAPIANGDRFDDKPRGSLHSLAAPGGAKVEVSVPQIASWAIYVWLPMALSLPYLIVLAKRATPSTAVYVLYVLSVTISSPLLALNYTFKAPLPIPSGLFDRANRKSVGSERRHHIPPSEPLPSLRRFRRSMSSSPTVVESRRSGDVWIKNGDAVEGKSRLGRAMSMLSRKPKMSVIPPEELQPESVNATPATVPGDSLKTVFITPEDLSQSDTSAAEFGHLPSSKFETRFSGTSVSEDSKGTKIMVAQRHYSALAQTIALVPGKVAEQEGESVANSSGVIVHESTGSHLRTRSIATSFSGPETPNISGASLPPSMPLPPTPPSVRAARQAQSNRKSFLSQYSFSPVDSVNEIDELSAGVLPLLIPGLQIGEDMTIRPSRGGSSRPMSYSQSTENQVATKANKLLASADVPARSSAAQPPSAASTDSLFEEFEAELQRNPHNQSTPQLVRKPTRPLPKGSKRSGISYIRSRDTTPPAGATASVDTACPPAREPIGQKFTPAAPSLIPKPSLRKLKVKNRSNENLDSGPGQSRGLRQLALLQSKDTNSCEDVSGTEPSGGKGESNGVRPLILAKKQQARRMTVSTTHDTVRELARSGSSTRRATLRETEVLPQVVVQPPSLTDEYPYHAY